MTEETTNDNPSNEDLTKDLEKWKSHARTWEDRAKVNAKAAEELAALRKSTMTEDEKRATELQEIRDELAKEREARELSDATNQRLSIVAEFSLSPGDAKVLDDISSIDAMRAVAARMSSSTTPPARAPQPNPSQGKSGGEITTAKEATIDALGSLFN